MIGDSCFRPSSPLPRLHHKLGIVCDLPVRQMVYDEGFV